MSTECVMGPEDILRVMIKAAPIGVVIVNPAGQIVLLNRIVETIFGYAHDDLLGQPLTRLIPDALRERHEHYCAGYFAAPRQRPMGIGLDLTARRSDGSTFPVEVSLGFAQTADGPLAMAFVSDITLRKELEAQKIEVEQLREAMIHTMVHDLRSPLSAIHMALNLIQSEVRLEDQQQMLVEIAFDNAKTMLRLIGNILDVSRLESGQMPVNAAAVMLATLVDEVAQGLSPLAREKSVQVNLELPADLPAVWVDSDLIGRVLQNLMGNAIKFTPEGGTVWVKAIYHDAKVWVTVRNTGSGVPSQIRAQLFQKFVSGSQKERGSGLGLAFCRLALEAHGEAIMLEDDSTPGAAFTFSLPVVN